MRRKELLRTYSRGSLVNRRLENVQSSFVIINIVTPISKKLLKHMRSIPISVIEHIVVFIHVVDFPLMFKSGLGASMPTIVICAISQEHPVEYNDSGVF